MSVPPVMSPVSLLLLCSLISCVYSHGYLQWPPSRSSMWRNQVGSSDIKNTKDRGLNCGGASVQWNTYGGKCGLCGDNYGATVRDHEVNVYGTVGKFVQKCVGACYHSSIHEIEVKVKITAHHKGYFEFRLCSHNDFNTAFSQECLNEHLLEVSNHNDDIPSWSTRFDITNLFEEPFVLKVKLPYGLVCYQCILQWKYHAGNNWGCSEDGKCGSGEGPQEEFYGCADLAILDDCGTAQSCVNATTYDPLTTIAPKPITNAPQPITNAPQPITNAPLPITNAPQPIATKSYTTTKPALKYKNCKAITKYADNALANRCCALNCEKNQCLDFCDCVLNLPCDPANFPVDKY